MCGRFCLFDELKEIENSFGIKAETEIAICESYNIPPGQPISCIGYDTVKQQPTFENMTWGITPVWAKTPSQFIINARAESVATKSTFRALLATKRCIVIASGYYEWRKAEKGANQPYYIFCHHKEPMALAALWSYGLSKEHKKIKRCVILTQPASTEMEAIHPRMPVIIPNHAISNWVNNNTFTDNNLDYLVDTSLKELAYYPVSDIVNSPKNNDSRCIEPFM